MCEVTLEKLKELLQNQTLELKQDIKNCIHEVNSNVQKTSEEINKLRKRNIFLERKVRKNNIIIFGLDINNETSLIAQTVNTLNELLGLHISVGDLNNIYRLGRQPKAPIVVEFISFLKKAEIFNDTGKLAALRGSNISISNDLCEEDRREQKQLRKHLLEARHNNYQAKIRGHKLEINNKLYSLSELEDSDDESVSEQEPLGEVIKFGNTSGDKSQRQLCANIQNSESQEDDNSEKKRKTQTSPSTAVKVYKTRERKKTKYV